MMDMSAFMSSIGGDGERKDGGERKRPQSAGPRDRPRAGAGQGKDFKGFLERQNRIEMRRQKRIHDLRRANTPTHKPKLCDKSMKLTTGGAKGGSFLQRVAKDALRKEHDALRQKALTSKEPECTFKPNINTVSANRKARSVVEMSRGDSLKRETSARLMKLKQEQEELAGLTFKPALNTTNVKGRLQVLTDPDSYVQRLAKESRAFNEKALRAKQESDLKETAECTFAPKVSDAS